MRNPNARLARRVLSLIMFGGLAACGGANPDGPVRSPTLDYRPPPPTTAEGKPVGADGVRPEDKLEEGPATGTKTGLAPGWKADQEGLRYAPKQRVGGDIDVKNEGAGPSPSK
jgi:hypothetical protein